MTPEELRRIPLDELRRKLREDRKLEEEIEDKHYAEIGAFIENYPIGIPRNYRARLDL